MCMLWSNIDRGLLSSGLVAAVALLCGGNEFDPRSFISSDDPSRVISAASKSVLSRAFSKLAVLRNNGNLKRQSLL